MPAEYSGPSSSSDETPASGSGSGRLCRSGLPSPSELMSW
eukprot:CAMPEP_0175226604 /NCGR_PEP_ID=MMETSP0093-20121207/22980_1 /TAXON_ID=311494 /ORGANISM="Alexandrium monilatum, Strain CCMP3105" /LENGTH=39 /DNA_ID= /DNA_START= /DNA_END= /DNA_ORIENTATION=